MISKVANIFKSEETEKTFGDNFMYELNIKSNQIAPKNPQLSSILYNLKNDNGIK